VLTATVTYAGSNRFSISITDSRSGTFSTTQKGRGSLFSAEAIAEAPSSRSGVLPLTNFGTVGFTGTKVNGQAIGTFPASSIDRIDMASGSTTKASTSTLTNNTDFTVTWKHS